MIGGYQILNFNNVSLTSGSGVKIEGVYDTLEGNYRKPILISGLVIEGIEQVSTFSQFVVADGSYKTELAQGSIVITDDDTVSFIANLD